MNQLSYFYFTFGTDPRYPYQSGWVVVKAPSKQEAIRMFNRNYPKRNELVNCAFIYTEEEFKETIMYKKHNNHGNGCHEIIEPKVYIAGKITGDPHYRIKFAIAEEELKSHGYTLIMNPAIFPEGFEWHTYMHITGAMLEVCDTIYLLENWTDSKGAKIEAKRATEANYTILYQNPLNDPKMEPETPNKNDD